MTATQILVVDDNPLSRKLLNDMLGAEGYSVRNAASGFEALSAIAEERPDLVLLDIMMPGMDGFEVVRRLNADQATRIPPIIMVTALDDEGSRARLAAAGINVMLTKPVDRWELRSLLSRILSDSAEKSHE
ncbi:MAG: response regulator [Candidatus Thiodiazotropha sp. (ex Dulcina madagascariensis)]|nr:response regulator [Candidatus Thiodiazotropha sp. (ex Dulcina madagascariensis)]MCU7927063.1 response regulator [Candidatus Thiodiazotropha sp. (ex Dulcina madagascariensis)]